ncbi:hypothetical protein A2U01_0057876, partial [Trifolium medium]|nr:hypothetical protein [Trifolium medium]
KGRTCSTLAGRLGPRLWREARAPIEAGRPGPALLIRGFHAN